MLRCIGRAPTPLLRSSLNRTFAENVKKARSSSIFRFFLRPKVATCIALGGLTYSAYKYPYDRQKYVNSLENPSSIEVKTLTPKQVAAHTFLLNRFGSRLAGYVMSMTIPVSFRKSFYSWACRKLNANTEEFEGAFEDYPTPSSFFTRNLKPYARPIIDDPHILVSPVDGVVSVTDLNPIQDSRDFKVHQVKGVSYSLKEYLGQSVCPKDTNNNLYSMVVYLSPGDYHHIHSPTDVLLTQRKHFSGHLLPVMSYYASRVKGLFTLNERVVLSGEWSEGYMSVGMVGAYNVGSIHVTNDQDTQLRTNQSRQEYRMKGVCESKQYDPIVKADVGDRIGSFNFGSTIVLAFEASDFVFTVQPGERVKMGQPIGYLRAHASTAAEKCSKEYYESVREQAKQQCFENESRVVIAKSSSVETSSPSSATTTSTTTTTTTTASNEVIVPSPSSSSSSSDVDSILELPTTTTTSSSPSLIIEPIDAIFTPVSTGSDHTPNYDIIKDDTWSIRRYRERKDRDSDYW